MNVSSVDIQSVYASSELIKLLLDHIEFIQFCGLVKVGVLCFALEALGDNFNFGVLIPLILPFSSHPVEENRVTAMI